jgi:hypothetical protein
MTQGVFPRIVIAVSNIKFHENLSSENRAGAGGRTEGRTDRQSGRHKEANSRFKQLNKHA